MPDQQTEPCPSCDSLLDVTGAQIFAERTCPVCGTQINVRRTFGHYELTGMVGSGGQGVVYRAMDTTLNRLVALKLLRTEYSANAEFVKQFENEAQLTASINHPNVVRVYSFGAIEDLVFLAMELVDKGNLDELMEKLGRVPEARALQIGIEIAQGLRAGNEKGLVHRDVKPGNILFAEDGTAKIVDFGLAMFFEQAAQEKGEIWGTPYYLSPERLNKAAEDFRSDIYSLGATLFHAIAGRAPFEAKDASQVALKHLSTQALSLQAFAPDVCNSTSYVINRTLSKNPADRQQSYEELIEQLQFAREEALQRARGRGMQKSARLVIENREAEKAMSWVTIGTLIVLVAGLVVGTMLIVKASKGDGRPAPSPAPAPAKTATTIEGFGPGWPAARDRLLAGENDLAAQAFRDLGAQAGAGSPAADIARVHQALAEALGGRPAESLATLKGLGDERSPVATYFHREVVPKLAAKRPVPGVLARNMDKTGYDTVAALFYALNNCELGEVNDARAFASVFIGMNPAPEIAWLADYRGLAKPLLAEIATYGVAADAWKFARNLNERQAAIARLRELPAKLHPGSRLLPSAKKLLASMEQKLAAELAEVMKRNLAYKAKATAGTSDQKAGATPDRAVDGDPQTQWTGTAPGEKWLALDLGSPRQISRWVVKTAGSAGEKQDLNLVEAILQRSDDGSTWTDVDTIKENRRDIMDRVVSPFTARQVRLISSRGGQKRDDNSMRVAEFELGNAADQPTAGYGPADSVAMRFSAETDFVAGPVGKPGAVGSARFDAKNGRFSVTGAGADVGGNTDGFHFAWQPIEGDCEIVARVTKLEKRHDWTRAGIMIRSGFAKDASHCAIACAPGDKLQFLTRKEPGKSTRGETPPGGPLPVWLKLVRKGAVITGYKSADGAAWQEIGRETLEGIGTVAFAGLFVCSHVNGQLSTSEFESVAIRPQ